MENIEARLVIEKLSKIKELFGKLGPKSVRTRIITKNILEVLSVLKSNIIDDVAGYYLNHRKGSPYSNVNDEYKVQDLVYSILRPLIGDLQYENPQPKARGALASTRVDFFSDSLSFLLEIKFIDSSIKARKVESEIHEDISKYGRSARFRHLVFFIYCKDYTFPNKEQFETGLSAEHTIGKNQFFTYCIVN